MHFIPGFLGQSRRHAEKDKEIAKKRRNIELAKERKEVLQKEINKIDQQIRQKVPHLMSEKKHFEKELSKTINDLNDVIAELAKIQR